MSTKQRGDVERFPAPNPPALFRVWLDARHDNALDFNRDEFRRIWEAGNKEFGGNSTVYINASVQELAEKDAEIARLKADGCHRFHHQSLQAEINEAKAELSVAQREIARLRGWLGKIQKHEINSCDCCGDLGLETTAFLWAGKALSGEKVPE